MVEQKPLAYPAVPNIDDQIVSRERVAFDVFVYGDTFTHLELGAGMPAVTVLGHQLAQGEDGLTWDGTPTTAAALRPQGVIVIAHQELTVATTAVPVSGVLLGSGTLADIQYATKAVVYLRPQEDETFQFALTAKDLPVYLNGQRFTAANGQFQRGNELVVDGLWLTYDPQLWKFGSFDHRNVTFNLARMRRVPYTPAYPEGFPEYHRSPRIILTPPKDTVKISDPERKETLGRNSLMRTILPPLAMVSASFATSILSHGNPLMSVGMGGASMVTAGLTTSAYFTNKKDTKVKNKTRLQDFDEVLIEKQAALAKLAAQQRAAVTYQYPDSDALAELIMTYSRRLFERTATNADYLSVALGTGVVSASYKVDYAPNDRKDPLIKRAEKVANAARTLSDMPITTSFNGQAIGLVGRPDITHRAVETALLQLAAFQSYRDVQFIALVPEATYGRDWAKWRWLRHFQLQELNLRGLVHDAQSRDMLLTSLYQLLTKRKQLLREKNGNEKVEFSPRYVLIIADDSWLNGHQLNEFLAEGMTQYGVDVIWLKEDVSQLPETITTYARYDNQDAAVLVNEAGEYVNEPFAPARLPQRYPLAQVIRTLANLNHVETEKNAIPENVSFLELYKAKRVDDLNVDARWQKANTAKSLAVPLGLRGKDDIVYLNLHERADGPHGLVAGTTGSGKSEALQSYILSLAVNFAPEDVGFLPIDFKGGGMANLFANLPHLLGSITNLDGAGSARALASIHAELQKRQRLFSEYGVNHINGYTKLYKQGKTVSDPQEKAKYPKKPLPHLFLISDEFAELKANEPDFMAELVSTARIGRSLGVHLILATQKPSGVVDDQIWSNSRFKLALKVQDVADSNEILKTPDAASIVEPGRAYLQVGNNETYELFQTAYSGADYDPEASHEAKIDERIWAINNLGQYELLTEDLSDQDEVQHAEPEDKETELAATVDYIAEVAKEDHAVLPDKPWLPPLDDEIVAPAIDFKAEWQKPRDLSVPVGVMDIPSQQLQKPFAFDLNNFSNTVIFSSPGYGKTTFLQTLVMNLAKENTPADLNINLLDFGTNGLLPLAKLPQVADIVRLDEEEKLMKMVGRITNLLENRKKLFQQKGVATLEQYEEKAEHLPVVLNIVDAYDAVAESKLRESIDTVITQILREGPALGVYLVISANRSNSLRMAMMSNVETKIALYLVDDTEPRSIIGKESIIQQEIPGRGQIKVDEGVEAFQTYLPASGDSAIAQLNQLEDDVANMAKSWTGKVPVPIPMVPDEYDLSQFNANPEVVAARNSGILPVGYDLQDTHPYGFELLKSTLFVMSAVDKGQLEAQRQVLIDQTQHFKTQLNIPTILIDFDDAIDSAGFDVQYRDADADGKDILKLMADAVGKANAGEMDDKFIYIADLEDFLKNVTISADDLTLVLKKGYKSGLHLIVQAGDEFLGRSFDGTVKAMRGEIEAGIDGARMIDTELIPLTGSSREPYLPADEAYYFTDHGRAAAKMRLPKPIKEDE